jgi:hypothetical protein
VNLPPGANEFTRDRANRPGILDPSADGSTSRRRAVRTTQPRTPWPGPGMWANVASAGNIHSGLGACSARRVPGRAHSTRFSAPLCRPAADAYRPGMRGLASGIAGGSRRTVGSGGRPSAARWSAICSARERSPSADRIGAARGDSATWLTA